MCEVISLQWNRLLTCCSVRFSKKAAAAECAEKASGLERAILVLDEEE